MLSDNPHFCTSVRSKSKMILRPMQRVKTKQQRGVHMTINPTPLLHRNILKQVSKYSGERQKKAQAVSIWWQTFLIWTAPACSSRVSTAGQQVANFWINIWINIWIWIKIFGHLSALPASRLLAAKLAISPTEENCAKLFFKCLIFCFGKFYCCCCKYISVILSGGRLISPGEQLASEWVASCLW